MSKAAKKPKIIAATQAQNQFGSCLKQVIRTGEPLFIEKHGKSVAVLMDYRSWSKLQGEVPDFELKWIASCEKLHEAVSKRNTSQSCATHVLKQLREEEPV